MSTEDTTARRGRRSPGQVAMIVIGAVVGLISLALLAGGGGLTWANQTQRDDAGYFTSSTDRYATPSYALTEESLDAHGVPGWIRTNKVATVRIRATADKPVFVGIARRDAVSTYLGGVEHARVTDFGSSADLHPVAGTAPAGPPASQRIWAASASGAGTVSVAWPIEKGRWSLVVMNADGSRGVSADLQAGAKVKYLGWAAVGLFVGGGILLAVAVLLVLLGTRGGGGGARAPAETSPAPEPGVYPVQIRGRLDEPLSRGLWIVKWLLAIPHYIVLSFLWVAFVALTIVAFFAILLTGRYPRGIFDFNVGVLRWTWRVGYYATQAIGTDRYPPFSLGPEPDYPATLDVAYPEQLSRGLVLVKWWLLAIPHYVVIGILAGGGWIVGWGEHVRYGGGGLIGIMVIVAGVVLLFTGKYPRSIYDFVLGLNRWVFRVVAYAALMTDEYPPFRLDQGGEEPTVAAGPVPAGA